MSSTVARMIQVPDGVGVSTPIAVKIGEKMHEFIPVRVDSDGADEIERQQWALDDQWTAKKITASQRLISYIRLNSKISDETALALRKLDVQKLSFLLDKIREVVAGISEEEKKTG
jgi:hypothetical protein